MGVDFLFLWAHYVFFHSGRQYSESEDEKVPWDTQRRDRDRRDSERWDNERRDSERWDRERRDSERWDRERRDSERRHRERRDSERRDRKRRDSERRDRERRDSELWDRESHAMAAVRGRLTTLETIEKGKVKTLSGTDGPGGAANS